MKKILPLLICAGLSLSFLWSARFPADPDEPREFKINNRVYRIETRSFRSRTDVFLRGAEEKNLSRDFAGDNRFAEVAVTKNRYFITWNNHWNGRLSLCFYDSRDGKSRRAALDGFSFISRPEVIFREDSSALLVFRGNNSDNDDLFLYETPSGRLLNLTRTPGHEKIFSLETNGPQCHITTETLYKRYCYRVDTTSLEFELLEEKVIRQDPENRQVTWNATTLNTIIAFGDSITCGEMNMEDLEGELHPELAYLTRVQEKLEEYGQTHTINLGKSATNTYRAVVRMDEDLKGNDGYFFLILYGSNDVGWNLFSADSSAENLRWICLNARNRYGMYPIISTIPPQQLWEIGVQVNRENTEALNQLIIGFALEDRIAYIDSYTAFFECEEGWVACLEDIKGRHPSPLGHDIMADLFKAEILVLDPAKPENISLIERDQNTIKVGWSENLEFDFEQYHIQFGFSESCLDRTAHSRANGFSFLHFPPGSQINHDIYFRVQAADQDGHTSDFSPVYHFRFTQ